LSIPELGNLGKTLKLWRLELATGFWKCKVGSRHDSLKTSLTESNSLLFFAALSFFPKLEGLSLRMRNIRISPDRQIYHGFGYVPLEKYFIARSPDSKRKSLSIDIERNELLKEMFQYIIIPAKQEKQYAYQEVKLSVFH
jgi:hypothetical protein